jgi:drug/metabolite transporter (DMT)-like permease
MALPRSDSASPLRYPVSGWVEAGFFVVSIAALSVSYVVGQQIGAHPVALILYAMLASAVALLAITGTGPDAMRILLAPQSLLVGIGTIGVEVFYYALLEHVGPAHGSLLFRLAIPLSLALSWTLFARRPQRLSWLGAAVVLAGIVPLIVSVERSTAPPQPAWPSPPRSRPICAASRPSSTHGTGGRKPYSRSCGSRASSCS